MASIVINRIKLAEFGITVSANWCFKKYNNNKLLSYKYELYIFMFQNFSMSTNTNVVIYEILFTFEKIVKHIILNIWNILSNVIAFKIFLIISLYVSLLAIIIQNIA